MINRKRSAVLAAAALVSAAVAQVAYGDIVTTQLPATLAGSVATSTTRGFIVRSVQAPELPALGNSFVRAFRQLNGTLTDATNGIVANEAFVGPNPDGSYTVDTINFEKDGDPEMNVTDGDGNVVATYVTSPFPGIPGQNGHTANFAVEVVTYLQLPAGTNIFGISSGGDRVDAVDDDGYQAFVAANPRDFFATKVSEAEKHTSAPFTSNQHLETQFALVAPVPGIYPFRLVYWQSGLGANLQLYTINADGSRSLVNDVGDGAAIAAFVDSTIPAANSPYVAEVSPLPGSAGINAKDPIVALLINGTTTVNQGTIGLSLNGSAVLPTKTPGTGRTTVSFNPSPLRPDAGNAVKLTYSDSGSVAHTASWNFTINVAGGNANAVAGQWDFDAGSLKATIGQDLAYLDPTYDGPAGSAAAKTEFGTTTSFGIPDINGKPAKVMHVPGDVSPRIGYAMTHGIPPNGGGTKVNQYTLVMDVLVAETGPGAAALLRVRPTGADDGDLFWQGNNFGQGGGGYNGTGAFTPGVWHRVVAAYDEAATPPVVTKYVDGIKQDDWTANQGLDHPRRALNPVAYLFADGTPADERREMWVNSVQIRPGKLSDAQIVLLGGPDANGIPTSIAPSNVAGQWDFEAGNLAATIGKNLQYLDPTFDGPDAVTAGTATDEPTAFGTTDDFGLPPINGVVAKVMQVPGLVDPKIGYVMDHGIAPNGGGTKVNQYTLIMDLMVDDTGSGAAALLRVRATGADDGDLFWQNNNFGQGGGGYNGTGAFVPKVWHRVVAAYDEAATPPVATKYVDGIKQDDWTANQGLDHPRRAMSPLAYLFADGTPADERRKFWVKSIQVRASKLTDAQIVALGGVTGGPIPVATPDANVAGQWDFQQGNLAATIGKNLTYLDPTADGPDAVTAGTAVDDPTTFGLTTDLGIPDLDGVPVKVVAVSGNVDPRIGFAMDHGIAPNGGGTKVNQYTLIMDLMVSDSGSGAAALLRVRPTGADDGDLFWQGNNFGQGGGGYNGTGAFVPMAWHRVVAAYNEAATPPVVTKYVDGIFQDDWTANQGLDHPRRALNPIAYLFADGTPADERRKFWVHSVQIRPGTLSKAQIEALGGPSTNGIPVIITVPPAAVLSVASVGGQTVVSWSDTLTGFTLESTPVLAPAAWTPVAGVTGNSYTVTGAGAAAYYRLTK
ncbi:MAG TPA: hypothetical protein VMF06_13680 [Candidatus Limnocylindria bacterium]|nr:hypothetical protein [Candidatus Limnocylindria bacterium]